MASIERARTRNQKLLVTALLAAILTTLLVLACAHSPSEAPRTRFSVSPPKNITFADLDKAGPALVSPDGSRLVFVGVDASGKSQLWVQLLESQAARPIPGTANATYPFWAPDSHDLAFFADGKLKKASVDGGSPKTICAAPSGRGGSWGISGVIVFAPGDAAGLSRVSSAGGDPVAVTALDSSRTEVSHQQPEFLPDSRHFLYVAISDRTDNDGIFIGDANAQSDPKNTRRLMPGAARVSYAPAPSAATPNGYLLFHRDNNLMAQPFDTRRMELSGEPFVVAGHVAHGFSRHTSDFSVSANGVLAWRTRSGYRQLAWFDRNGRQIDGLDARAPYFNPSLSPDGKRIAVSRLDSLSPPAGNIWMLDPVGRSPVRCTSGPGAQLLPVWSPDGRRIAYSLVRPPDYGLYWKDGGAAAKEELLLKTTQWSVPMDWSRDGRFLLFAQQDPKTKWDLWLLPLAGDRKPVPVIQTEFNEGDGQFSPDGRSIAYWSDESGRWEVYVRPFTARATGALGQKRQVSAAGGTWPRWRGDGKELYFKALDGKLMAVPVIASATFGTPVTLFDPHDLEPDNLTYDVQPDGQRFLISRVTESGPPQPVNVLLNWLAKVKK